MLAGLVTLLPSTFAAKSYIPYAYNTSVPEIHNRPVVASKGWFALNTSTTATCPSNSTDCPSQNTTVITGPTGNGQFWMSVLEAQGQVIFSDGPFSGVPLGYAAANTSNYLPYASQDSGVLSLANSTDGARLFLTFEGGEDFAACGEPTTAADGHYSVNAGFVDDSGRDYPCWQMQVYLVETELEPVQFYDCAGCEYRCDNRYDMGCLTQ